MKAIGLFVTLLTLAAQFAFSTTVSEVQDRGELVVLAFDIPTGHFVRPQPNGEFAGFDVDLLRSFARSLGVDLQIRLFDRFDAMLAGLLAGEGDVIGGGLSITPTRQEVVAFSQPYFPSAVMVVAAATSSISSLPDLRGKVGATVPGSSMAERMAHVQGVTIHEVQYITQMFRAVKEKKADFAIADADTALRELPKYPGLATRFPLPQPDHYAFALAPEGDLIEALNAHLGSLEGQLYHLVNKHFGERGVELFRLAQSLESGAPRD